MPWLWDSVAAYRLRKADVQKWLTGKFGDYDFSLSVGLLASSALGGIDLTMSAPAIPRSLQLLGSEKVDGGESRQAVR
jgi:hypothetical protein